MTKRYLKFIGLVPLITITLCSCAGQSSSTASDQANQEPSTASKESASGNVSLKVWGFEDDEALLNTIFENFKVANPGTNIELTFEAVSESECKDILLRDLANGADVFTFADDQLSTMVAAGVLQPVTSPDKIKSRNSKSSVDASTINDVLYAFPLTADNGYFMYYNKEYFKESDMENLDNILSIASSKNKKVTMDWNSGWYFFSFYGNTGLEVGLNEDGISNYCTWNSTEGDIKGVDVLDSIIKIADNPGFQMGDDVTLVDGAKDGNIIAGISGVWSATALKKIWGKNFGATKLPTYTCNGKQIQMSSYAGYKIVGVNHYSNNIQWAEKFAEFMTNEENQTLRFEQRSQGPSNTNAASSDKIATSEPIQALIKQSEFARLQRVGTAYWQPVSDFGCKIASHDINLNKKQQQLDELVKQITASNSSN